MLSVPIPACVGDQHRESEAEFRVKDLIGADVAKRVFPSADALDARARRTSTLPMHGTVPPSWRKAINIRGGSMTVFGFAPYFRHVQSRPASSAPAAPAEPVLGGRIHHRHLAMRIEQRDLLLELATAGRRRPRPGTRGTPHSRVGRRGFSRRSRRGSGALHARGTVSSPGAPWRSASRWTCCRRSDPSSTSSSSHWSYVWESTLSMLS